jgi:pimeloyl-ACP methyl ester carboxylesterase
MAAHVEVNGVPMWYDERGNGDPLVLLHGGLSDVGTSPVTSTRWPAGFGCCCPSVGVTATPPTWQGPSRWR